MRSGTKVGSSTEGGAGGCADKKTPTRRRSTHCAGSRQAPEMQAGRESEGVIREAEVRKQPGQPAASPATDRFIPPAAETRRRGTKKTRGKLQPPQPWQKHTTLRMDRRHNRASPRPRPPDFRLRSVLDGSVSPWLNGPVDASEQRDRDFPVTRKILLAGPRTREEALRCA